MATIKNIKNYTNEQLKSEIARGGKFVFFTYTVSLAVMTLKRSSSIVFIPAGEGTFKHRVGYSTVNAIMGWWGIPWGPIYTIGAMFNNMSGGKDVTSEVVSQLGLNAHSGYNVPGTSAPSSSSGYNIPGTNTNQGSQQSSPQQGTSAYNIPGTNNNPAGNNSNNNPTYNIPR